MHEYKCGLCHCAKCKHGYVIVSSVSRTLMIELNCEKTILNFELIFSEQNLLKIQYVPHLKFRNLEKENENASKKSHSSRAFQQ
jgi:hypothetical protein